MEDFNALAAQLAAGVGDARGCLIVSRDDLVMGVHPLDGEARLRPAWLLFCGLGEPERSFVQFGNEIWCYVRRGPYAAFVVTGVAVRPGLVIDQIEQILVSAQERREAMTVPEVHREAARQETPLHLEPEPADEPVVIHARSTAAPAAVASPAPGGERASSGAPTAPQVGYQVGPVNPDPAGAGSGAGKNDPVRRSATPAGVTPDRRLAEPGWPTPADDAGEASTNEEIDRAMLAREFSQLLQQDDSGADG